ncbi:hypothetical protein QCA50_003174 [Cerrena zonata]|uniref:Uncharacterized protein n=1 Tax=Cerrena zonata TaxID=2478898 RepID=A0AAW0GRC8_9APHY
MFIIGCVMFVLATMHVGMNCFRMVRGYVDEVNSPGGAAAFLSNLAPWDHIFKDTIYATTEMLGDGVAIYRCWIIWDRSYKVIALPGVLLIASIISGYMVCGLYATFDPTTSVFDPKLTHWVRTFYSVAVVQSAITTGLMAYRIYQAEKRTAKYRTGQSPLRPVLYILLESASLLFFVELVLLTLYAANYNCQYLMLEPVTPLVGITFTAITLRISLRSAEGTSKRSITSNTRGMPADSQFGTVGTIPMRHIAINVTKDVEAHGSSDGTSFVDFDKPLDGKKEPMYAE